MSLSYASAGICGRRLNWGRLPPSSSLSFLSLASSSNRLPGHGSRGDPLFPLPETSLFPGVSRPF